MLTKTSIRNPAFVCQVRRAMRMASIRAVALGLRHPMAEVFNRKGQVVAFVWAYLDAPSGPQFEVFDKHDRDITNTVREVFTELRISAQHEAI